MQLNDTHKQPPDWPQLIREYRLSLTLSRKEFAVLYNVSRQAVYYWETGKREAPGPVTLDVLRYLQGGLNE